MSDVLVTMAAEFDAMSDMVVTMLDELLAMLAVFDAI